MEKHPEGGYYSRTYESSQQLEYNGIQRPIYTTIYYLIEVGDYSSFHQLDSDEILHFYSGAPLIVHQICDQGQGYTAAHLNNKGAFQLRIDKGRWFAIEVAPNVNKSREVNYSLIGCSVSPGFSFSSFRLATKRELLKRCPQQKNLIKRLTRS